MLINYNAFHRGKITGVSSADEHSEVQISCLLDLSDDELASVMHHISRLEDVLAFCSSVARLNGLRARLPRWVFAHGELNTVGCNALVLALQRPLPVRVVELGQLAGEVEDTCSENLWKEIGASRTLDALTVRFNAFGCAGALTIAQMVASNQALRSLTLEMCDIGPQGARALAHAMCESSSLNTFGLPYNKLGPDGARAIADGMGSSSSLTSLDLRANRMGHSGAEAIANGLARCHSLQMLNMSTNDLGGRGAVALAAGLRRRHRLTAVDFGFSGLDETGTLTLLAVLRGGTIVSIGLGHCGLRSVEGATAVSECITTSHRLSKLNLRDNSFGRDAAMALIDAGAFRGALRWLQLKFNQFDGPTKAMLHLAAANATEGKLKLFT